MRRRGRASTAEDLMDLVAMLPWWVGIGLAVLSYFLLHAEASSPLPVAKTPQDIGQMATSGIWRGLAYAGQYILPFICVIGALASAIRRRERRALVGSVACSHAADALDGMSWREFELLVGEGFRQQGYAVLEAGGGAPDGGIDLVLAKAGEKFLVQCKQWKAFKVGVKVVRELYGVMAARGAAGGFVVTSGRFTEEAKAFASGRNIRLIDGPELLHLIRQGRSVSPAVSEPAHGEAVAASPPRVGSPSCPVCSKSMLRRVSKRGASAGTAFWGCSGYPGCKGTRPI